MPVLPHIAMSHAAAEGHMHVDRLPTPGDVQHAKVDVVKLANAGQLALVAPSGTADGTTTTTTPAFSRKGTADTAAGRSAANVALRKPNISALLAYADDGKYVRNERAVNVASTLKSGQAPTLHGIQKKFRQNAKEAMQKGGDVGQLIVKDTMEAKYEGIPILWAPNAVGGLSRPMNDRIAELEKELMLAEASRREAEARVDVIKQELEAKENEVKEMQKELRDFATMGVDERITRLIERAEAGIVTRNEQIEQLQRQIVELNDEMLRQRQEAHEKVGQLEVALGASAQTVARHKREVQLTVARSAALNAGLKYLLPDFDKVADDHLVVDYASMQVAMRAVLTELVGVLGPNAAALVFAPAGLDANVPRPWNVSTVVAGASPFWRQAQPTGRQTKAGPEGKLSSRISYAQEMALEGVESDDLSASESVGVDGSDFLYTCFDKESIQRASRPASVESDVVTLLKWGLGLLEDEQLPPAGSVVRFLALPCSFADPGTENAIIRATLVVCVHEVPTKGNLAYEAGDEVRVPACELAAEACGRLLMEEVERRKNAVKPKTQDPALEAMLERKMRVMAASSFDGAGGGAGAIDAEDEDSSITEFDESRFQDLLVRLSESRKVVTGLLKRLNDMPAAISEVRNYQTPPPGIVETILATFILVRYTVYKAYRTKSMEFDIREFREDKKAGPVELSEGKRFAFQWGLLKKDTSRKERSNLLVGAWKQIVQTGSLKSRKLISTMQEASRVKIPLDLGGAAMQIMKDFTTERVYESSLAAGMLFEYTYKMAELTIIERQIKRMKRLKKLQDERSKNTSSEADEPKIDGMGSLSTSEVDQMESTSRIQDGSPAAAVYDAAMSHGKSHAKVNPSDLLVSGGTGDAFAKKKTKGKKKTLI